MLRTLIVEDNAAHRRSLLRLLEVRFPAMEIDEAADGWQGLQRALSRHFDLIFTDIRLPNGNGLDLAKAIRMVSGDTVICVITSYDIAEYREAAYRNGANQFIVKGESSEVETIVELVESLLRKHFVTSIILSDTLCRKQLNTLLSIRWPAMFVAEASDAEAGLGQVEALKPDLVLLELGIPGVVTADLTREIHARIPRATLVGLTDDPLWASQSMADVWGVEYCVPLTPMGHTELMGIVAALQQRTHH